MLRNSTNNKQPRLPRFVPLIAPLALLFSASAIFAENAPSPLIPSILASRSSLVNYAESSETPPLFDANGREVRLRSVLGRPVQCPRYESWRAAPSDLQIGNKLKLRFTNPLKGGTLIVTSETPETAFLTSPVVDGKTLPISWRSNSISVIELPATTSFDGFDFSSLKLRRKFKNARMVNRGKEVEAPKCEFALHTIALLKERFANLARYAAVSAAAGPLLRKSEKGKVGAFGINDMKTEDFWRGEASEKGGVCPVELTWEVPVTLGSLGVLIPWNNAQNMPASVTVFGRNTPKANGENSRNTRNSTMTSISGENCTSFRYQKANTRP